MKILYMFLGAIVLIYLSFCAYTYISLDDELDNKIKNGAIILDVRTVQEYNAGHIKGAVHFPYRTMKEKYTELDKNKTYITCCSHGFRSVKVQKFLTRKEFENVYNGGVWSKLEKLVDKSSQKN